MLIEIAWVWSLFLFVWTVFFYAYVCMYVCMCGSPKIWLSHLCMLHVLFLYFSTKNPFASNYVSSLLLNWFHNTWRMFVAKLVLSTNMLRLLCSLRFVWFYSDTHFWRFIHTFIVFALRWIVCGCPFTYSHSFFTAPFVCARTFIHTHT